MNVKLFFNGFFFHINEEWKIQTEESNVQFEFSYIDKFFCRVSFQYDSVVGVRI